MMLSRSLSWKLFSSFFVLLGVGLGVMTFISARQIASVTPDPSRFHVALAISYVLVALPAALACFVLTRWILSPIDEIAESVAAIARGDLERRPKTARGALGVLAHGIDSLAVDLKRRMSDLRQEKRILHRLLAEMHDGVLACDRKVRLVFANDSLARLFGVDLTNAVGRPLADVFPSEPLVTLVQERLDAGGVGRVEIEIGADRRVRAIATSIAGAGEEGPHALVVVYDVTEAYRYESLRRQFVANVSHELRTPVSIVKGFLETLQDEKDPARISDFVGRIGRNVQQLANLVDDLLQLSRLESHTGISELQEVDAGAVAARVVAMFEPVYTRKGQRVGVTRDESLPAIQADERLLERAVSNLLDNAVKYTPEGGTIDVRVAAEETGCLIEVRDSGIGIPEADLPRIYERFYRVDKSRSREMGGTGLGLAIVKHIAQIHRGRVGVKSVVRQGSTFSLWLPQKPSASGPAPAEIYYGMP